MPARITTCRCWSRRGATQLTGEADRPDVLLRPCRFLTDPAFRAEWPRRVPRPAAADAHRPGLPARYRRPQGHERRLRRRRLRRMHGRARRIGEGWAPHRVSRGELLHSLPADFGWQGTRHGRRFAPALGRRSPGAAVDDRQPRLPMRLLHAGLRHVAVRAVPERRRRRARTHSRCAVGQSLPLHGISADHRCRSSPVDLSDTGPLEPRGIPIRERVWRRFGASSAMPAQPRRSNIRAIMRRAASKSSPMHSRLGPTRCCSRAAPTSACESRSSCASCPPWSISATWRSSGVSRSVRTSCGSAPRSPSRTPGRRCSARIPQLEEQAARFASPPIRNSATLCGNLANGSPIGDSIPALIALGAQIELRRGAQLRRVPLEDFYLGYRKTDRAAGEFVTGVAIPRAAAGRLLASYKLSKRIDQDISAVSATFCVSVDGDRVQSVRLAYGGLAGIACRAPACRACARRLRLDSAGDRGRRRRARDRLQTLVGSARHGRLSSARRRQSVAPLFSATAADAPIARVRPMHCGTWTSACHPVPRRPTTARRCTSAARAQYCDDIALPANTLHAAFGLSRIAHGRIRSLDLSAVLASPGVASIALPADIPGENNYGGAVHDDPIFAEHEVQYAGQPLFAVAADSMRAARKAARCEARRDAAPRAARYPRRARRRELCAAESDHAARRCARAARPGAAHRLRASLVIGGQDHFYLEGQIAVGHAAGRRRRCWCTARPSIRPKCKASWRTPWAPAPIAVVVQCRRMGGGFGGKESQAGADRRRRRDPGAQDRAAGQAASRPRRRHADDRQAA